MSDGRCIGSAELARLSRLLDDVLDLDDAGRERRLARLEAGDRPLLPALRRMLERRGAHGSGELLDRGAVLVAPEAQIAGEPGTGDTIGPYRLLRRLGLGGMGEVWLAEKLGGELRRPVALKLPMLPLRRDVLVQRFARERDILGSLSHPHIARLYDAGLAADGQPYLALEYVEGEPITDYCAYRALPLRERVALLQQVLQAVQSAHANLVVHRDLKPSNVLVTRDGQAMLLDFGIAKLLHPDAGEAEATELTHLGGRAMTLDYAAPEQVRGAPIGVAADIWALGVLLYELATLRRPFGAGAAGDRHAHERSILELEPPRPSQLGATPLAGVPRALAADFDTIVLKALKKNSAERYASADAFGDDLARWLVGAPVLAQRDSRGYRLRKFVARHRLAVGAGSLALAALAATAALAVGLAMEGREQAARAEAQARLAQREARHAEAVQGFLLDLFRSTRDQADPLLAQQATARELLDAGAKRVDDSLRDAPEVRLQVLATLAQMYRHLGLPARAFALEQRRLDLAHSVLPAHDPRRAAAALALVPHLYDGAGRASARSLIEEARAVLDAAGDTRSDIRAELLLQSARFYRYESLADAQRAADAALRFILSRGGSDRALLRARLYAGASRLAALDLEGAQQHFEAGHQGARRRHGNEGAMALTLMAGELADVQQSIGRFADAEATLREAIEAAERVYGPLQRVPLVFRIQLCALLLQSGRTEAGLAAQAAIRRDIAAAGARLDAAWLRNADYLLARNQTERGVSGPTLALLRGAVDEVARELPNSGVLVHRRRQLAEALTAVGQLAEARTELELALDEWRRFTAGIEQPWMSSNLRLAEARLLLAEGRPAAALLVLEGIVPTRLPADAVFDLWLARRDVVLAEARLALGSAQAAAAAAEGVLQQLQRIAAPASMPHLEASALTVLGRAQAQLGRAAAARASLEHARTLRERHDEPRSQWLAQVHMALAALPAAPTAPR